MRTQLIAHWVTTVLLVFSVLSGGAGIFFNMTGAAASRALRDASPCHANSTLSIRSFPSEAGAGKTPRLYALD